jgi:hypothetical protein
MPHFPTIEFFGSSANTPFVPTLVLTTLTTMVRSIFGDFCVRFVCFVTAYFMTPDAAH